MRRPDAEPRGECERGMPPAERFAGLCRSIASIATDQLAVRQIPTATATSDPECSK
jgi:hypothetical protein